ncbi:MAG TPA: hypothetical protein VHR72_12405, partial [Gemmataceae bacterium]|nr:hypothetical protein [Gemmataceae bacterium]
KKSAERNRNTPQAQRLIYLGEYCRHKANQLRDSVFAAALAAGKPIPDTNDSSTGERFRSFTSLPDALQSEAISRLRNATDLLPDDLGLVTEGLRTELMLWPIQWTQVKVLAEATLKLKPEDPRSLYLLARIEFEQPTLDDPTKATPPTRRNLARIRKSFEYLTELKKTPNYPPWRVALLEARIHGWMNDDAVRRGDDAAARTEQAALAAMFWGDADLIARSQKGEGLSGALSGWDVEGVLGMFDQAVKLAVFTAAPAERTVQVVRVNHEFAKFSKPRPGRNDTNLSIEAVSTGMMSVLLQSDRLLTGPGRAEWAGMLEAYRTRWQAEMERGQLTPPVVSAFADECRLESRRQRSTSPANADRLEAQANEWIETSLRTAADKHLSASVQATLHASAAYGKIIAGAPRSEVAGHLKALAACPEPALRAIGNILEGFSLVKVGALEQANEKLELLHRALDPDRMLPAHLLLNEIFAGTANADRLLPSLRLLERTLDDQPDRFTTSERVWLADLAPDLDRIRFLMAQAHLEMAQDKHYRYLLKNPGQEPPQDLWAGHVREASELAKKLSPASPYRIYLHQQDALCALSLGQRARATFVVGALRALPGEKLSAISLAVALAFPPGNGTRQYADELEAEFRQRLAKEPTDSATRVGLALILARTGRAEEAVKILESYVSRPDIKGDRLLVEQIDLLDMVAEQVDRPGMWKTLRPLFAASLIRYPLDPRAALAIGEAEAALGNVDAASRELERTINLAGCRNIRFTSTDRERMIERAQKALDRFKRN